jgi:glycerophosphoryl diester phosphodiesterase
MHDATVDRSTTAAGRVTALRFAELHAADAGGGEPVPSLDEALDLVSGRAALLCELKATPEDPALDGRLVEQVLETIGRHRAWNWCAIHSFRVAMVAQARALDPRIPGCVISPAAGAAGPERLLEAALAAHAQAVSIEHDCITRDLAVLVKQRHLTLWAWTADDSESWERLAGAGVDGIITNVPGRLRAHLGEQVRRERPGGYE